MSWSEAMRRALVSGSSASLLSALALAVCSRLEGGTALGPLNGPSQWIWGEQAAYRRDATLQHTLLGGTIHHLSALMWATLHEKHFVRPAETKSLRGHVAAAAVTAAVAAFVDYRLTPRRLQPGFEKQLSRTSLAAVYAAFAIGLLAPRLLRRSAAARAPALRMLFAQRNARPRFVRPAHRAQEL